MGVLTFGGKRFDVKPTAGKPLGDPIFAADVQAVMRRWVYRWSCVTGSGIPLVSPTTDRDGIPLPNLVFFYHERALMPGGPTHNTRRIQSIRSFLSHTDFTSMAQAKEALDTIVETSAKAMPPAEWEDLKEILSYRVSLEIRFRYFELTLLPEQGQPAPFIRVYFGLPDRGFLRLEPLDICAPDALAQLMAQEPGLLEREISFNVPGLTTLNKQLRTESIDAEIALIQQRIDYLEGEASPMTEGMRDQHRAHKARLEQQRAALNPN